MADENKTQTEPQVTDPQTEPKQGDGTQGGTEGDPKPAAEGQGGGSSWEADMARAADGELVGSGLLFMGMG